MKYPAPKKLKRLSGGTIIRKQKRFSLATAFQENENKKKENRAGETYLKK